MASAGFGPRGWAATVLTLMLPLMGCSPTAPRDVAQLPETPTTSPQRELDGGVPVVIGEPIDIRGLEGRIVFDDFEDLYVMWADGTHVRPVADRPGPESDGAWAPDGRRIVYRDSRRGINENDEIYIIKADGSRARNLTQNPANDWGPDWSPDGKMIVFNSDRDGGPLSGYLVSPDGSDLHRIPTDTFVEYPDWSPDGKRIVFMGQDPVTHDYDIYVVNVDGTDLRRIQVQPCEWPDTSRRRPNLARATPPPV